MKRLRLRAKVMLFLLVVVLGSFLVPSSTNEITANFEPVSLEPVHSQVYTELGGGDPIEVIVYEDGKYKKIRLDSEDDLDDFEDAQIFPNYEYYIFEVELDEVYDLQTLHSQGQGDGVDVAIIDTGVNGADFSISFTDDSMEDLHGHGTSVSKVLNEVAPGVEIYSAKVFDENGRADTFDIIAGINWAVEQNVDVISMSFGANSLNSDPLMDSAIENAIDSGVIVVVASGNCRRGCNGFNGVTYPGSLQDVITVGAVSEDGYVSSYSSSQQFDDYSKPDVVGYGDVLIDGESFVGTSFATPQVTGMIAMYLEENGNLNQEEINDLLPSITKDVSYTGFDIDTGYGLIDLSNNSYTQIIEENLSLVNGSMYNFSLNPDGWYTVVKNRSDDHWNGTVTNIFKGVDSVILLNKSASINLVFNSFNLENSWVGNDLQIYEMIFSNNSNESDLILEYYKGVTGDLTFEQVESKYLNIIAKPVNVSEFRFTPSIGGEIDDPVPISFGTSYSDTFYPSILFSNYYSVTTSEIGELRFAIEDMSSGLDLDLEVWDYNFGNRLCRESSDGSSDEECFIDKPTSSNWLFNLKIKAYGSTGSAKIVTSVDQSCEEGWLEETFYCASGNRVKGSYQDDTCYIDTNEVFTDCDDLDESGWIGPLTCMGDNIVQDYYENDAYCSDSSSVVCKFNTIDTADKVKSTKGDADYCDLAEQAGCGCPGEFSVELLDVTPSTGISGDDATLNVKVTLNGGSTSQSTFIEGYVIPESWAVNFGLATVIPNLNNPCPENLNYDSKVVELNPGDSETFDITVKIPEDGDVDECGDQGSAWSDTMYAGVSIYEAAGSSYDASDVQLYPVIESCETTGCDLGFVCSELTRQCEVLPTCDLPDGSSFENNCDCNSDSDCSAEPNYICDQGSGPDACVYYLAPDECDSVDDYICQNNKVYRCDIQNDRKVLKLLDSCAWDEYCPSNVDVVKQCVTITDYDLVIDYASSKVDVYKQVGDKVLVRIFVDQSTNEQLQFNSNAFSGSCSIQVGTNLCEFDVLEEGTYGFRFIDQVETVHVINNPYALFVTSVDQLFDEYLDDGGVNALLAKTYEQAEKYRGVVYDLDELELDHPSNSYMSADETNDYVVQAASYIKQKCNGCRETIIIGNEEVVPQYLHTSDAEFFGFTNEDYREFYTDDVFTEVDRYLFSDFDELFYHQGGYEGKSILFLMPSNYNELQDGIDDLAYSLDQYAPSITYKYQDDIACENFFGTTQEDGKTVVIIGDYEHNKAYECYRAINSNVDGAYVERNAWDLEEYAFVLNTNDEQIISDVALMISSGEIKNLKSHGAYLFKTTTDTLQTVAIVGAVAVVTVGTGGTAAPLLLAGAVALEVAADASAVGNDCFINKEGMGGCGTTVAFAVMPAAFGKAVKSLKVTDRLGTFVNNLNGIVRTSVDRITSKFPAAYSKAVRNSHDVEDFIVGAQKRFGDDFDEIDIARIRVGNQFSPEKAEVARLGLLRETGTQERFKDIVEDVNPGFNKQIFEIDLDWGKQFNIPDSDFLAVKNKATGGSIIFDKKTGQVLGGTEEIPFDSMGNPQQYVNVRKESLAKGKMISDGYSPVNLNNVRSQYPDLASFDDAGSINSLANTGPRDLWSRFDGTGGIAGKIKVLRSDGFSFGKEVRFQIDFDDLDVTLPRKNQGGLSLVDGLGDLVVPGSATKSSLKIYDLEGEEILLTFNKMEGIE